MDGESNTTTKRICIKAQLILSPSLLAWGRNHIRGSRKIMLNKINNTCQYCKGTIIKNYDRIYCIQCSREPNKSAPTIVTKQELQMHKRGEDSVNNRIKSAAVERGNY